MMMRIVVAEFAVDVEISQDRYVVAIVVVATIDVVDSLDALLVLLGAVGTVNLPCVSNMHVTAAQGQATMDGIDGYNNTELGGIGSGSRTSTIDGAGFNVDCCRSRPFSSSNSISSCKTNVSSSLSIMF